MKLKIELNKRIKDFNHIKVEIQKLEVSNSKIRRKTRKTIRSSRNLYQKHQNSTLRLKALTKKSDQTLTQRIFRTLNVGNFK